MNVRDYALTMAHYNRWMNEKLYTAVAGLSDAERKQDRGGFLRLHPRHAESSFTG